MFDLSHLARKIFMLHVCRNAFTDFTSIWLPHLADEKFIHCLHTRVHHRLGHEFSNWLNIAPVSALPALLSLSLLFLSFDIMFSWDGRRCWWNDAQFRSWNFIYHIRIFILATSISFLLSVLRNVMLREGLNWFGGIPVEEIFSPLVHYFASMLFTARDTNVSRTYRSSPTGHRFLSFGGKAISVRSAASALGVCLIQI